MVNHLGHNSILIAVKNVLHSAVRTHLKPIKWEMRASWRRLRKFKTTAGSFVLIGLKESLMAVLCTTSLKAYCASCQYCTAMFCCPPKFQKGSDICSGRRRGTSRGTRPEEGTVSHSSLYWHYRITTMDVRINWACVCGIEQTTECLCEVMMS